LLKFLSLCRKPKPFAFIEFINYEDARDAKEEMDRRDFHGRQIDVVFAQERRKTPDQMRVRDGPLPVRPVFLFLHTTKLIMSHMDASFFIHGVSRALICAITALHVSALHVSYLIAIDSSLFFSAAWLFSLTASGLLSLSASSG
jgi:hypothetical protein